jgi:hypothetical protein
MKSATWIIEYETNCVINGMNTKFPRYKKNLIYITDVYNTFNH